VRSAKAPMQRVPQSETFASVGLAITSDEEPKPEPEPDEQAQEAAPITTRRENIETDTSSEYSSDEEPGEPGPSTHMLTHLAGEQILNSSPRSPAGPLNAAAAALVNRPHSSTTHRSRACRSRTTTIASLLPEKGIDTIVLPPAREQQPSPTTTAGNGRSSG
jgi:hypothetical protein